MALIGKIKNKIKLIKAKKNVDKGKNFEGSWGKDKVLHYFKYEIDETHSLKGHATESKRNRARFDYFFNLVNKKLSIVEDKPILELGTNAGYVLSNLFNEGYHNLSGVEINPNAIKVMKKMFPQMHDNSTIINGAFETVLPDLSSNKYHLVYNHAVLMHVHPESNFIFEHMARICSKYIITIEAEKTITVRHYPRDYKKIFENLGFTQIFFEMTGNKIHEFGNFHCRIFEKK